MTADNSADPTQLEAGAPDPEINPESYEEFMAGRWRKAILRLSEKFIDAAGERSDLSPILLEAMHNALSNLLVYGEAGDLMALEEWLNVEDDGAPVSTEDTSRSLATRAGDRRGDDRRVVFTPVSQDRRSGLRRTDERRAVRDWSFEAIPSSPGGTLEGRFG